MSRPPRWGAGGGGGGISKADADAAYAQVDKSTGKLPPSALPYDAPIRVPGTATYDVSNTTTRVVVNRWPVVSFPSGGTSGTAVAVMLPGLPADWTTVDVGIRWVNLGTGGGNVGWRADVGVITENGSITQPPSSSIRFLQAKSQNAHMVDWLTTVTPAYPGQSLMLNLLRASNSDTLANAAGLVEIVLRKALPRTVIGTDLAWYWLIRPRLKWHTDGKLYFGGVSSGGVISAAVYDPATQVATKTSLGTYETDDHNNPALLMSAGKPPIAFYCRHALDQYMRYRVASDPDSIAAFAAEKTIDMGSGRSVSYPEVFEVGGALHLFCRVGLNGPGQQSNAWAYTRSTDWGTTWTTPQLLMDLGSGNQCYMASVLAPDGVTLRCALNGHPSPTQSADHNVYYVEINLNTGDVRAIGSATVIGNIRTGTNLPLTPSTAPLIYSPPSGTTTQIFDVSDAPNVELVWGEKDLGDSNTANSLYRTYTRVGGSWRSAVVVAAGERFGYLAQGFYVGGCTFPRQTPGGRIYLTRSDNGTGWYAEKYVSTDGDTTWKRDLVLGQGLKRTGRPYCIEGSGPFSMVYESINYYDFNTYSYYSKDLVAVTG